jgi:hypothetical protein
MRRREGSKKNKKIIASAANFLCGWTQHGQADVQRA